MSFDSESLTDLGSHLLSPWKELIDLFLTNEITISDLLRGLANKALDELWRIDE